MAPGADATPLRVLAVDGSPGGPGRTATALEAVLAAAASAGAQPRTVRLADAGVEDVLAAAAEADAFVLGSPVHRASFAAPLKALLDALPRGMWGETQAPITGRAAAIVATGATWHHFLALDDLRAVLGGFFAAHVVAPGLYVPHEGFDEDRRLRETFAEQAARQGRALVDLAHAIAASPSLAGARPQA